MKLILSIFFLIFGFNAFSIEEDINLKDITFNELLNDNNIEELNDLGSFTFNKCVISRDDNGKLKYIETFLERNGNKIFDFNVHHKYLNSHQEIYEIPFYSITAWDWYQTYAFKTNNSEHVSNYSQAMKRRNMIVNTKLIEDIMRYGQLSIYVHQDKKTDNKKFLLENITITNPNYLTDCFALEK